MMAGRERLIAQIEAHEGFRRHVYDDKTGRPIVPGSVVEGHPTVGIGLALDKDGLRREEALIILDRRLDERETQLWALPGFAAIDDVRQHVLVEMAFNLGFRGLLNFRRMWAAIERRDWLTAVAEMKDSAWATQIGPQRLAKLMRQMLTGEW